MNRLFKWFLMLCKRLYKKPTFLIILSIIPICLFILGVTSHTDSGFVHIVVACEDKNDEISKDITKRLIDANSLIRFTETESPEKAVSMVRRGLADAAWILPSGLSERINTHGKTEGIIKIIEKESTVPVRLSREKLAGVLYKYSARAKFLEYTRTNIPKLNTLTDSQVLEYYDSCEISEQLFIFPDSQNAAKSSHQNVSYLLSPIRGMLGILCVLCALAAALYYLQDDKKGTFSLIPLTKKPLIAFACIFIAVINICAITIISLFVSGLNTGLLTELCAIVLYAVSVSLFALFFMQLVKSINMLSCLMPTLIIAMLAICPVFFDLRSLRFVQLIFPPTYYVNAIHDIKYLLYMVIYIVVLAVLCLGQGYISTKSLPHER